MAQHRRRARLGAGDVFVALRYRDAILLRARRKTYGEIADALSYESRSGAVDAIRAGVARSGLRPGLAAVMHRRLDALYQRVLARVGDDLNFDAVLFDI